MGLSRGSPGVSFRGAAVLWCWEVSSNILESFFSCSVGSALEVFDGSKNSRMLVFLQTVFGLCAKSVNHDGMVGLFGGQTINDPRRCIGF